MKVSLVTSCFNREKTIAFTIESVLNQDYEDIEYIIQDGGSSDGTMEIIQKYRDRISSVLSEPDNGMYQGLNRGIRRTTGDIIGLVHSDDVLYANDTISHIVEEFERTGADLLYADGIFVKQDNHSRPVRNWIGGVYSKKKVQNGWLPLHTTVYVKREVYEKVGLYDENYKIAADSDFLVRCLYKNDLRVTYLHEYVVNMRMGGLSTSPKKKKKKWKEDIHMYKSHGINPYITVVKKICRKIPQYIEAFFMKSLK